MKNTTLKLARHFGLGRMNFRQASGSLVKTKIKTNTGLFVVVFLCFCHLGFTQSAPNFGAAANFALFTVTGAVANTGTTSITGDIGTNTGAITGFGVPTVVHGTIHTPDTVTQLASADLLVAYNQLYNTAPTNTSHVASFGNGETLIPGVYTRTGAATINGTLTLDAQGNSNALFIFKSGGALSSGAEAKIILINGALARNVFWLAEGEIALAAATKMCGTLIGHNGAVSIAAGATLHGRMYSTTGAIAVDASSIVITESGSGMTVSPNQTICSGMWPEALTLSGNTGIVVKWQRSSDAIFTSPIDIVSTAQALTSTVIGNLTVTTYFRAVTTTEAGIFLFSDYACVSIYSGNHPDFGVAADFIFFTINGAVGNTGTSHITGNIGTNLGVISGFETPTVVEGNFHNADAVTLQAGSDLISAYNALQTLTPTSTTHPAAFGNGEILTAGVYAVATAATVAGTLTLDAQGNQDAQFVFRIGGAFSSAIDTNIVLANGASAENIFWVAEGAIGIGASTNMSGTMIANHGAVSMGANGVLYGRMYSTAGAIASNGNLATAVGDGIAGVVAANQTLCSGSDAADLVLTGNTGTVIKWQKATDPEFSTSQEINITSSVLTSSSIGTLNATTYFRAVVRKGFCEEAYSEYAVINVIPQTAGGKVSPDQVFCKMGMPSNLTLAENIGNVLKWQSAADVAFTIDVTDIASTAITLSGAAIGTISSTKYFRAIVQSDGCSIRNSEAARILIPATLTYANGVWDGVPDSNTPVIIASDLNLAADMHVCSCVVSNSAILTVPSGINLIIEQDIAVENTASLIVQNNGSLLQVDDSGTAIGNITVYRDSAPMKLYDYSYWSAPVQNWRLNQLSPNTLSDKFYSWNPLINNWNPLPGGTQIMEPAKGYIVRAPQGWSATNASAGIYGGNFTGTPNTGIVPVLIQKGTSGFNLIGNPYPSAIDIDLFLEDEANSGIVNGTIYLWTHNTAISSTIPGKSTYNYTSDDYAKYNLTGGIKTASAAITGLSAPDGKIASGQGFFIEANPSLANGSYTANFNNGMRVSNNNNCFYRKSTIENGVNPPQKNRLWLAITNSQGAYNEVLVGYVTGATDGFDNLYDGKTFASGNVLSLYSIVGTDHYSIQGRALPFNESEILPIGLKTTISGIFTIGIESFDGLFQDQEVYLTDKLNNTTLNLKTAGYTFNTSIGTFNDRFELRFTNSSPTASNSIFSKRNVIVYKHDRELAIITGNVVMKEVRIYDIRGRLLLQKSHINASETSWLTDLSNEVLIVVITSEKNETITKKIVLTTK